MGQGTKPPADQHFESFDSVANTRNGTDVVHSAQAARVIRASRERNLELPAEVLRVGMPQHEVRHRLGVRSHVKDLVLADARVRAAGDVAHHVAAGLAGGDSDFRQATHQVRRVVDIHEMALKILPSRHVEHTHGVLFGDVCQRNQLIRVQPAHRDLDALHLDPILTLSVHAVAQSEFREDLLVDQAGLHAAQLGLEDVDFLSDIRGQVTPFGTGIDWRDGRCGHAA